MNRYQPVKDKKSTGAVISAAIILIILASVAWFYSQYRQNHIVAEPETQALALPSVSREVSAIDPISIGASIEGRATTEIEGDNAIGQQGSAFVLPDLERSDALLREAMTGISPGFAEWLNTDQLIRKYVVMANDFSQGLRLEKHLRFVKLEQPFTVEQEFIATKSYQRYDRLAAAINGLDVSAALAAYKKFRPLLVQVFKEFSYPAEYSVEDILTKAAAVMLAAPVIEGNLTVERHAIYYKFADPQLEALSPIHKQMLRMGPENTRIIQNKLRLLVEGLVNLKEQL